MTPTQPPLGPQPDSPLPPLPERPDLAVASARAAISAPLTSILDEGRLPHPDLTYWPLEDEDPLGAI